LFKIYKYITTNNRGRGDKKYDKENQIVWVDQTAREHCYAGLYLEKGMKKGKT
jgi:hypothetical protein